MKAIILEDENVALRRLKKMLIDNDVEIVGEASSLEKFAELANLELSTDVYFLDINLTDGNIFDYLEEYPISKPIIFTTAYDQYALKAFQLYSIDYLLKPFTKNDLRRALDKFERHFQNKNQKLDNLLSYLNQQRQEYKERILIKIGDKLKSISIEEINLFYSEHKMTMVFTKEGRSYPIDATLEQISKSLNPVDFFQVNRGVIVRIDAIEEVYIFSNSRLKVVLAGWNGEPVVVARERVNDFKGWLGR